MKNYIIVPLLFLAVLPGFNQNIRFEHPGGRAAIVNKLKLKEAKDLSDLITGYATYYKLGEYVSVEMHATSEGKPVSATSQGHLLSAEQRSILNAVDMGK